MSGNILKNKTKKKRSNQTHRVYRFVKTNGAEGGRGETGGVRATTEWSGGGAGGAGKNFRVSMPGRTKECENGRRVSEKIRCFIINRARRRPTPNVDYREKATIWRRVSRGRRARGSRTRSIKGLTGVRPVSEKRIKFSKTKKKKNTDKKHSTRTIIRYR